MRKRKSGVIVNMSSGASLDGIPTMGVYAGAKAGMDGMYQNSRASSHELQANGNS
jgi:short-subunit dehydrogenase